MATLPLLADSVVYNDYISLSPPKSGDFDVRDFRENMKEVKLKTEPFRLGFHQLAILESGGGVVSQDGQALELGKYTLFFNLPGQIIYWDVPQDWRGYYFNLSESYYTVPIDGYPRLRDLPFFRRYTTPIQLTAPEADQILTAFQLLYEEYSRPTPYLRQVSKALLNLLLAYTLRIYDRVAEADVAKASGQSVAERFRDLVSKRITSLSLGLEAESLSINEIAGELFVSPPHLSTTVREATGKTPTAYVQHLLIAEAQKLLLATSLSASEIAYQLDFQDPAYFSRVFKKVAGESPTAYRKKLR